MGTGKFRYAPPKRGHRQHVAHRASDQVAELQIAAERVRVARTLAVVRQDDESAKELADALDAFAKAKEARP